MALLIILEVTSICGYIYELIVDSIKKAMWKRKIMKMRGRRVDWKTRIRYKLEDCWDFLITPR